MKYLNWNQLIAGLHQPHVLQSSQWGAVKEHFGWQPYYLTWRKLAQGWEMNISQTDNSFSGPVQAAGLLLERKGLPGLTVLYMPKGPLLKDPQDSDLWESVVGDLADFAHQKGALQLKIDPDLEIGRGVPETDRAREVSGGQQFQDILASRGWRFSEEQIQFRNSVLVDLQDDEDAMLARMKSKTRYNIRLAGRKDIKVGRGSAADLDTLYRMYADTSNRAGFTIRGEEYYRVVWETFLGSGNGQDGNPVAQPLIAEYEGQPVAGAVIFAFGETAWYLHGMSLTDHSEKMPTYLIQWEAMRWAKELGCKRYDMWGAPDEFQKSDSLWGVYRFKRGFGGEVVRTIGAWDYPARPPLYRLYNNWLPRLLDVMRWFGDLRTRRVSQKKSG
jgi:lipid II:glycine glycyltransferase (peptidoglycan interpeptide bridge formation enzyme)